MAKHVSHLEKISLPLGVKWILKENEDGGLEWYAESKAGITTTDTRDKKKRAKAGETRHGGKRTEVRATSNMTNRVGRTTVGKHGNRHGSPQRTGKHAQKHSTVMLDDIKAVAYDQLCEIEQISPDFDRVVFKAEVFDYFLYYLVYYFDCFFTKQDLELKNRLSTSIEPGLSERKQFADACAKVEVARKRLGRAYCHLVLGMGLESVHHMGCGTKRVSGTHRDRSLYETMYGYCCFVIWITFKRKHFDVIKKEIGKTLRSDTFNPAIRIKNAPENEEDEKTDVKQPKPKMAPAEYRRLHPKRPAIKSIINQRSPAIVSILPSAKEESTHLFSRIKPPSLTTLAASANVTLGDDEALQELEEEIDRIDQAILKGSIRIGILHDTMNNYNATSLQPRGQDGEATADEEGEAVDKVDAEIAGDGTNKVLADGGPATRASTALSQATTEAPSELP